MTAQFPQDNRALISVLNAAGITHFEPHYRGPSLQLLDPFDEF
jgi:hypothetical protein